jgi:hypothetical protein
LASPDKKAFLLRLPPDLWEQLERLAAAEKENEKPKEKRK